MKSREYSDVRSVRFGNLIITKHAFDQYSKRLSGDFDFNKRDHRIRVARRIKDTLPKCVTVVKDDGQTILVDMESLVAFPVVIGPTMTKIVTCYLARPSLVNKANNVSDYGSALGERSEEPNQGKQAEPGGVLPLALAVFE